MGRGRDASGSRAGLQAGRALCPAGACHRTQPADPWLRHRHPQGCRTGWRGPTFVTRTAHRVGTTQSPASAWRPQAEATEPPPRPHSAPRSGRSHPRPWPIPEAGPEYERGGSPAAQFLVAGRGWSGCACCGSCCGACRGRRRRGPPRTWCWCWPTTWAGATWAGTARPSGRRGWTRWGRAACGWSATTRSRCARRPAASCSAAATR